VKTDLARWKKRWSLMPAFFTPAEIDELRGRLAAFRPHHVFFCSFESRFAKSGGLARVAMNALPSLQGTGRFESVSLLSPFYPRLIDGAMLSSTGLAFDVAYDGRLVRAELLALEVPCQSPRAGSFAEYYLKADGFFDSGTAFSDPYLYVDNDPVGNEKVLRANALFFCRAAPAAIAAIGRTENAVLHLQEWQTALLSLTAKDAMLEGLLTSCGTIQTMHNPYDAFIPKADLRQLTTSTARQARIDRLPGDGLTAFQVGLQLVDAPVATVSESFAVDLTGDVLQTEYFSPHLQSIFLRDPVVGINNGPFVGFSDKFPRRDEHTLDEIVRIKCDVRRELLKVLDTHHPPDRFGELTYQGASILNLPDDVPIVLMSGRLDPLQKGYDILLQALERFALDEIKAVLTPMPLRASDLDFFHTVADACRGNVTVFPNRMEKGYVELQTGATFGVMPSIYEPFGAAIEYMVSGTVNVARSTGGLVDQVADGDNGFRFREPEDFYDLPRIRDFMATADRVELRKGNHWALDMAGTLYETLKEASALYRYRRHDYHATILRGFARARTFSWEENSAGYCDLYETIAIV
jgi:glycogen synthase